MKRTRPWITLAALLALASCAQPDGAAAPPISEAAPYAGPQGAPPAEQKPRDLSLGRIGAAGPAGAPAAADPAVAQDVEDVTGGTESQLRGRPTKRMILGDSQDDAPARQPAAPRLEAPKVAFREVADEITVLEPPAALKEARLQKPMAKAFEKLKEVTLEEKAEAKIEDEEVPAREADKREKNDRSRGPANGKWAQHAQGGENVDDLLGSLDGAQGEAESARRRAEEPADRGEMEGGDHEQFGRDVGKSKHKGDEGRWTRDGLTRPAPDTSLLDDGWFALQHTTEKPASFLPRVFYFENTYQGRSAAFLERQRRLDAAYGGLDRPYTLASLPPQAVDPPEDKGLSLSVALDRPWIDQPGKVNLQVTLQGSSRFGWRRPPLDVAVVVDGDAAAQQPEQVAAALQRLLDTLGPQDRLGVVLAGPPPTVLAEVGDLRTTRQALGRLSGHVDVTEAGLAEGMLLAGRLLQVAGQGQARVPGSQIVLLLADRPPEGTDAIEAAHALTVQGATTSVIELDGGWSWWAVANAGHGNLHRVEDDNVAAAVDEELARISQVIARLLRVNIRLAPGVEAIRVLGSRVLDAEEVRQVKAREVATDRQLSASLGVKADRGDDDDGIQTVIPFFYGGDAHVIAVELWVDKPGPVAEITLRYKDMVALENATARASVRMGAVPRPTTGAELSVRRNVRGFLLAEALDRAGRLVARGDLSGARDLLLATEATAGQDAALLSGFRRALDRGDTPQALLSEALDYAGQRRISHVALR